MPAASEAVGAPAGGGCGGGDVEQEWEIRNDEDFVYKVPRGLYLDAAPSTTQSAAGPDPKAAGLRRRRRALLRLRAKRLRDLSRWEALGSELLAPLPAPQPPAQPFISPPASSHPVAAASSSSSASVLDELLAQVEIHTEVIKKVSQWCDEANALCDEREATIFDSLVALPMWSRNPSELVAALCSPSSDEEAPVGANGEISGNMHTNTIAGQATTSYISGKKDEQNGRQEASGVSSAAAEMIKNSVEKQKMGHHSPHILTESRMRKKVTNLSGSDNVALKSNFIEPKRKKASRCTSTAPGTPGSTTRRNATSTPARAPDIVCKPGPQTRRRAGAQKASPGSS